MLSEPRLLLHTGAPLVRGSYSQKGLENRALTEGMVRGDRRAGGAAPCGDHGTRSGRVRAPPRLLLADAEPSVFTNSDFPRPCGGRLVGLAQLE